MFRQDAQEAVGLLPIPEPSHPLSCAWGAESSLLLLCACNELPGNNTPLQTHWGSKKNLEMLPLSHLKISRLSSNKLVELQPKREGFNYCSLTWYREPERDLHLQQTPGTTKTRNHSFEPAKHPRNHSPESAKKPGTTALNLQQTPGTTVMHQTKPHEPQLTPG